MNGLGRRGFLAGAAAGVALRGRGAQAAALKAPRREVLSVGFNASRMDPRVVAQLTTFEVAVEIESPTTAIRIGVANNAPSPFTLHGVCCCEASGADHWAPRPRAEWRYLAFGGGAAPARYGAMPVTVPGNRLAATGATDVPAILWSDWLPYRTTAAGRPIMLFRVLVPPQQSTLSVANFPERTQDELPAFSPRLRAVKEVPGDFVTDPKPHPPVFTLANHAPLMVVQHRSTMPGVPIVVGGDSQVAQWFTFAQLAAMRLSTPTLPISVWDVAWGGAPSRTFWPILQTAIAQATPAVAVIQGWTWNDGHRVELWEHYFTEVQQSVELTRRLGGLPIVFKGMPRKLFGTPSQADWQTFNGALAQRLPGVPIFDLDRVVEDPARPGDWRAEFSRDGLHPNLAGGTAIAAAFDQFLQPLL